MLENDISVLTDPTFLPYNSSVAFTFSKYYPNFSLINVEVRGMETCREWPIVLRHYNENWKGPYLNPTRHLAGHRDPTLL